MRGHLFKIGHKENANQNKRYYFIPTRILTKYGKY